MFLFKMPSFRDQNKPHAMSRFLSFRALTQSFSWVKFWAAPRGVPSRQIKSCYTTPPCPVPWALPKTRNRPRKVHTECRMIRRMVLGKPANSSTNKSPKKRETPIRLQWSLMTLNKYGISKKPFRFCTCQIKQNSLGACKQRSCVLLFKP